MGWCGMNMREIALDLKTSHRPQNCQWEDTNVGKAMIGGAYAHGVKHESVLRVGRAHEDRNNRSERRFKGMESDARTFS